MKKLYNIGISTNNDDYLDTIISVHTEDEHEKIFNYILENKCVYNYLDITKKADTTAENFLDNLEG